MSRSMVVEIIIADQDIVCMIQRSLRSFCAINARSEPVNSINVIQNRGGNGYCNFPIQEHRQLLCIEFICSFLRLAGTIQLREHHHSASRPRYKRDLGTNKRRLVSDHIQCLKAN